MLPPKCFFKGTPETSRAPFKLVGRSSMSCRSSSQKLTRKPYDCYSMDSITNQRGLCIFCMTIYMSMIKHVLKMNGCQKAM